MQSSLRRREQEVWVALDELWSLHGDFSYLTGDAIKEHLVLQGKSKGSPNEIYKYRKTWAQSRKITINGYAERHEIVSDPINRAVLLVHEKLKEENQIELNKIKDQFKIELDNKAHEITLLKESISKLVNEYGLLEQREKTLIADKAKLTEQLSAEIDIRKLSDQEVHISRSKLLEEKKAQEVLLKEIKENHAQQIMHLTKEFNQININYNAHINRLEAEKKEMGHTFSEQLNELKLLIYNKDIIIKELQNKNNDTCLSLHNADKINKQLKEEIALLNIKTNQFDIECKKLNEFLASKDACEKRLQLALRKSAITIAKLRAYKG